MFGRVNAFPKVSAFAAFYAGLVVEEGEEEMVKLFSNYAERRFKRKHVWSDIWSIVALLFYTLSCTKNSIVGIFKQMQDICD
jgi:hypothetical protein